MSEMQRGGALPIEYEFNETENAVVADLAGAMSFVGLGSIIIGVLLLGLGGLSFVSAASASRYYQSFTAYVYAASLGLQGLVLAIVGAWTRSAASSFRQIVDTEGNDIGNLLFALGSLKRIYQLQRILLIVAIALFLLGFMLGVWGAMMR